MILKFTTELPKDWPPLCWVVRHNADESGVMDIWSGGLVEIGESYIVEGVWPGSFKEQEFDRSHLFFGTGVRVRGDVPRFVSSNSTVDRIWTHVDGPVIHVSNSLPALLSIAGVGLVPTEPRYADWVETIVRGRGYQGTFPIERGRLSVHYMEDLEIRNGKLDVAEKPQQEKAFDDFHTYEAFMYSTARQLGQNARSHSRTRPLEILSTISRGYDSPVATLMAREAGSRRALTLTSARSLLPRTDSGAEICRRLELLCEEFPMDRTLVKDEIYYWAANGTMQDMNLSIVEFPAGPSLLMTGFNGDQVWARQEKIPGNVLEREGTTGLGFCEHRLAKGIIHCPVPYWGIGQLSSIRQLAFKREMQPWTVGGDYDRPIPRRIVETAGIPRGSFATSKSATCVDELLLWPMAGQLAESYRDYLQRNQLPRPTWQIQPLGRGSVNAWRQVARARVRSILGSTSFGYPWKRYYEWERFLLPWAAEVLVGRY